MNFNQAKQYLNENQYELVDLILNESENVAENTDNNLSTVIELLNQIKKSITLFQNEGYEIVRPNALGFFCRKGNNTFAINLIAKGRGENINLGIEVSMNSLSKIRELHADPFAEDIVECCKDMAEE